MDAQHQPALLQVAQLIETKTPLLLSVGGSPSQRNHLLTELSKNHAHNHPTLYINSHKALEPQVLNDIFSKKEHAQVTKTNVSLEHQLQAILDNLSNDKTSCILIADNAHELPFSVLAAFVHLAMQQENSNHTCLYIVLSGEPELREKMQQLSPNDNIPCITLETPSATPISETIATPVIRPSNTTVWSKHAVKITAWGLLTLFTYGLWQYNTHQESHISQQPLLPRASLTVADKKQSPALTQKLATHKQTTPDENKPHSTYTIQLASGPSKHALKTLQKTISIPNTRILEVVQDNKFWFVLLSGNYQSLSAAKQARNKLPTTVQKNHPWIRPINTYPKSGNTEQPQTAMAQNGHL